MELPFDLLKLIVMYIKNTKDIFNLRLTNKLFYSINKMIPIYINNTKLYLVPHFSISSQVSVVIK